MRALNALSGCRRALAYAVLALGTAARAHASLTLLVGEPYGNFGTMMPVGHAAVYLDRVCADGPLKLRMCQPGEPAGVVVARYHAIGPYDWMATPILEFLYATNAPEEIPASVTAEHAWEMRQAYRRQYLSDIVPDGTEEKSGDNEWAETVGAAYDRRIWAFKFDTTEERDQSFIDTMNKDPNRHRYRLGGSNCADFAADVINFYFAGAVSRAERIADFGVMSPKHLARSVTAYGARHPEANLQVLKIPQTPGTLRRSRPIRGGAEAILKTKRYLATLLVIQPEIPLVLTILYLDHGRWHIGDGATVETASDFVHQAPAGGDAVAAR